MKIKTHRGSDFRTFLEKEGILKEVECRALSQKDARRVLALIDSPPKPNKQLKDAVKRFKGTVRALN